MRVHVSVCMFVCLCAEDGNTFFIFAIRYVNQLEVGDAFLHRFTVCLLWRFQEDSRYSTFHISPETSACHYTAETEYMMGCRHMWHYCICERKKKSFNLLLAVLFEIHKTSSHLNDKCQVPTEPIPYSL